jgi:hypothetical protein
MPHVLHDNRWLVLAPLMVILFMVSVIVLIFFVCSSGLIRNPLEVPGMPLQGVDVTTGSGSGPSLEVDSQLTRDGIAVREKQRQVTKIVIQITPTQRDQDSANYSYVLFDRRGEKLSSSNFSIPRLKKDEVFEWEIEDDALPAASRLIIRYFAP